MLRKHLNVQSYGPKTFLDGPVCNKARPSKLKTWSVGWLVTTFKKHCYFLMLTFPYVLICLEFNINKTKYTD